MKRIIYSITNILLKILKFEKQIVVFQKTHTEMKANSTIRFTFETITYF